MRGTLVRSEEPERRAQQGSAPLGQQGAVEALSTPHTNVYGEPERESLFPSNVFSFEHHACTWFERRPISGSAAFLEPHKTFTGCNAMPVSIRRRTVAFHRTGMFQRLIHATVTLSPAPTPRHRHAGSVGAKSSDTRSVREQRLWGCGALGSPLTHPSR